MRLKQKDGLGLEDVKKMMTRAGKMCTINDCVRGKYFEEDH